MKFRENLISSLGTAWPISNHRTTASFEFRPVTAIHEGKQSTRVVRRMERVGFVGTSGDGDYTRAITRDSGVRISLETGANDGKIRVTGLSGKQPIDRSAAVGVWCARTRELCLRNHARERDKFRAPCSIRTRHGRNPLPGLLSAIHAGITWI